MTLIFKIDEKDTLWLLLCRNINIRDIKKSKIEDIDQEIVYVGRKKNSTPDERVFIDHVRIEYKYDKESKMYRYTTKFDPLYCYQCTSTNNNNVLNDIKIKHIIYAYNSGILTKDNDYIFPAKKMVKYSDDPSDDDIDDIYRDNDEDKLYMSNDLPIILHRICKTINKDNISKYTSNSTWMNVDIYVCDICYHLFTYSDTHTYHKTTYKQKDDDIDNTNNIILPHIHTHIDNKIIDSKITKKNTSNRIYNNGIIDRYVSRYNNKQFTPLYSTHNNSNMMKDNDTLTNDSLKMYNNNRSVAVLNDVSKGKKKKVDHKYSSSHNIHTNNDINYKTCLQIFSDSKKYQQLI